MDMHTDGLPEKDTNQKQRMTHLTPQKYKIFYN